MKPKYSLGERVTLKPSAYGFSALRKIEKTSIGLVVRRIEICEKHDNSKACAICNKIAYRFVGDNESNEGGDADWSWCLVEKNSIKYTLKFKKPKKFKIKRKKFGN